MQCSCGGVMAEHAVQRQRQRVGIYHRCKACGRCEIPAHLRSLIDDEIRDLMAETADDAPGLRKRG